VREAALYVPAPAHRAAQLQPIRALCLRRPARLASSSCGRHEYSRCMRRTDRQTSVVRQHHCSMPPPRGGGHNNRIYLAPYGHNFRGAGCTMIRYDVVHVHACQNGRDVANFRSKWRQDNRLLPPTRRLCFRRP